MNLAEPIHFIVSPFSMGAENGAMKR